jgi:DNA-binding Lrp family transcriptional regulator
MGSEIHEKTIKNIANILDLLRQNGELHIRGISKALGLNPFTVCNIINKHLDFFVNSRTIDQFGIRLKLVSLKPGKEETTVEDVLKYVKVKRRIKGN